MSATATTSFVVVCSDGSRRHGSHPSQGVADHTIAWGALGCPSVPHRVVREVSFESDLLTRRGKHRRVRA